MMNSNNDDKEKDQKDEQVDDEKKESNEITQQIKITLDQQIYEHVESKPLNVATQLFTTKKCEFEFKNNQKNVIEFFYMHTPFERDQKQFRLSFWQRDLLMSSDPENKQYIQLKSHDVHLHIQCEKNGESVLINQKQVNHIQVFIYQHEFEVLKYSKNDEKKCSLQYLSHKIEDAQSIRTANLDTKEFTENDCERVQLKKTQFLENIIPAGVDNYFIPIDNNQPSYDQEYIKNHKDRDNILNEWILEQPQIEEQNVPIEKSKFQIIKMTENENKRFKAQEPDKCYLVSVEPFTQGIICCLLKPGDKQPKTNSIDCNIYGNIEEEIKHKSLQVFDFELDPINYSIDFKDEESIFLQKNVAFDQFLQEFDEVILNLDDGHMKVFFIKKTVKQGGVFQVFDYLHDDVKFIKAQDDFKIEQEKKEIFDKINLPLNIKDLFVAHGLESENGVFTRLFYSAVKVARNINFIQIQQVNKEIKKQQSIVWIKCEEEDDCEIQKIDSHLIFFDNSQSLKILNLQTNIPDQGNMLEYIFVNINFADSKTQVKKESIENTYTELFYMTENLNHTVYIIDNFVQPISFSLDKKVEDDKNKKKDDKEDDEKDKEVKEEDQEEGKFPFNVKAYPQQQFIMIFENDPKYIYLTLAGILQSALLSIENQDTEKDEVISENIEKLEFDNLEFTYGGQPVKIHYQGQYKDISFAMLDTENNQIIEEEIQFTMNRKYN